MCVFLFLKTSLYFCKINISQHCKEEDLEICAFELETKLIIVSLYRGSTGDFNQFMMNLDDALKHLYKPKAEFSICGDMKTLSH